MSCNSNINYANSKFQILIQSTICVPHDDISDSMQLPEHSLKIIILYLLINLFLYFKVGPKNY